VKSVAELKDAARAIQRAALSAADPAAAVRGNLRVSGTTMIACGREYPLDRAVLVLSAGKASRAMADAALDILGRHVSETIVVMPHGYPAPGRRARMTVFEAGHPLPDEQGMAAARLIASRTAALGHGDLCLLLLSGGGSSLLALPHPPLTLQDKVETTSLLLRCGADIHEINTVRKHLSAIKGGRLASGSEGTIVTLAISDVVGDELSFIASGPTMPDPTTFVDALEVLGRYDLLESVPFAAKAFLERGVSGGEPETPKTLPERFSSSVIASSCSAVDAAAREARRQGFEPHVLTTELRGEAREAGRSMAAVARRVRDQGQPLPTPACILAAGETTVTIVGTGRGGRNQEIALSAALELSEDHGILLASFATDGKEGNTDAAGGFASGETIGAGMRAGLDPHACLAANDAHRFLEAAGDLIVTGPTGTNVNDITCVLVEGGRR
jgi:hydroxypyruvate reductase